MADSRTIKAANERSHGAHCGLTAGCDSGGPRRYGFTLIEVLVVVFIMGLIAALVIGLAKRASDTKKFTRVQVELQKWVTMIDAYHDKQGFYPPSNPAHSIPGVGPVGLAVTPLFYELAGSTITTDSGGKVIYTTLTTGDVLEKALVSPVFGLDGLVNASTEKGEVQSFGRNIQASDLIELQMPGLSNPIKLPKVPVAGPPPWGVTNTWHYNAKNPTNNPKSYDLWAEIVVNGKTNIIGNWRR